MTTSNHTDAPTILLVEDNQSIREPLQAILERWGGYTVLTADDGHQALRIYDKHSHSIALVVTDMVMPQMNGRALIQALYERNQDIKVICFTGQLVEQADAIKMPVTIEWLSKPVDGRDLVELINKLLG